MRPALAVAALLWMLAPGDVAAGDGARARVDPHVAPWTAVGMVNTAAYGRCTGVLIGSRRVVTAAHCVYNKRTRRFVRPEAVHFVLGYDRGAFAFNTVASAIRLGPGYDPEKPFETLRSDWAVLDLPASVPDGTMPIAVSTDTLRAGSPMTAAGYGEDRAYALSATSACPFLARDGAGMIAAACTIVHGYSGGPLMDASGRLAGIVVAGGTRQGRGVVFAVAAGAWDAPADTGSRAAPISAPP